MNHRPDPDPPTIEERAEAHNLQLQAEEWEWFEYLSKLNK